MNEDIKPEIVDQFSAEALKKAQVVEGHGHNMVAVNNYVLGAKYGYGIGKEWKTKDMDLITDTINKLGFVIELKESQRNEWAQSCIKKQEEIESLQEAYGNLKIESGEWIKLEPGNPVPDYDEYVLWAFPDGTCLWDAIDKDGSPWLYGGEFQGFEYPKATHFRKIKTPDECDEIFNMK